jgi:Tfp pilus assembly protein PilF
MGEVMLRSDAPQVAILYLKHAEKMDPHNYTTHTLLAQAYRRTGQEDAAKQEMEIASKIHADSQLRLEPLK